MNQHKIRSCIIAPQVQRAWRTANTVCRVAAQAVVDQCGMIEPASALLREPREQFERMIRA
jgi:hypothetical protein